MFRNNARVIIVIYVDEMLIIAKLLLLIFDTVKLLNSGFPIRPLSKLYYYLGIRIIRNR